MDAYEEKALATALDALVPRGFRSGARTIRQRDVDQLHPVEFGEIRSAAPVRRREFASGRALLRSLIGQNVPIPIGDDRKPMLPAGIIGSIAHDRRVVVGAVASRTVASAIGVDIEPFTGIEPDVARMILHPDDGTDDPVLAFVLKEAAYKAWSNAGGRLLEHHEVRVTMGARAPSGAGDFTANIAPEGAELAGRFVPTGDAWLAVVVIDA